MRFFLTAGGLLLVGCIPMVGPPTRGGFACFDQALGEGESDVDCGGPCDPCPVGQRCGSAVDCDTGVCGAGECQPQALPCTPPYSGCSSFVDLTDEGADRTIVASGAPNRYTPSCARIRLGQTVKFTGDLVVHPLRQACGPVSEVLTGSAGNSVSFTMNAMGLFGYYCPRHGSVGGYGMAGALEVVR